MKIKLCYILVLFLFTHVNLLSAQRSGELFFTGKVLSRNDSTALGGVEIKSYKKASKRLGNVGEVTYSNTFGIFEILASTEDSLCFEKNGFFNKCYVLDNQRRFEVFLDSVVEKEQYFDPFSVTLNSAGKTDRAIGDIPASVVVISKKEIEQLGYQSIEEILVNIPGLYGVEQQDWTGQGMNIGARGFYSSGLNNEMIIMINGVTMLEDHWSFTPLSRMDVPVESIERIEVVRGPMSVIYGSGAFLGSINIITNQGISEQTGTTTSTSINAGPQGDFRFAAVVNAKSDVGQHVFSLGHRTDPGVDTDFSNILGNFSGNASTAGLFQDKRTFLNYSGRFGKFRVNVALGQAEKELFSTAESQQGDEARIVGGHGQLGYSTMLGKDSAIILDAKLGFFLHRNFQDYGRGNPARYNGLGSFESNAIEFELNSIYLLSKTKLNMPIELTFGTYYREAYGLFTSYHLPPFLENNYYKLGDRTNKINLGLIFNSFTKLRKNVELVAGIRYEVIPEYNIQSKLGYNYDADSSGQAIGWGVDNFISSPQIAVLIPRTGLIWKLNQTNILKLLYGQGIKQPSFGQLSDGATLQESRISSLELNYLLNAQLRPKTVSSAGVINQVNVSLFYNKLNGLIDRISERGTDGSYQFISKNQGEISTLGLELSNSLNVNRWQIKLSYTLQFSENETQIITKVDNQTGEEVVGLVPNTAFSPRSLFYFSLFGSPYNNWTLGMKWRFVDEMSSEFDSRFNSSGEAIGYGSNLQRSSAYWIGDIHLAYEFPVGRKAQLKLSGSVKNLMNSEVRYPYGANTPWANQGMLARGRFILFGINYTFD